MARPGAVWQQQFAEPETERSEPAMAGRGPVARLVEQRPRLGPAARLTAQRPPGLALAAQEVEAVAPRPPRRAGLAAAAALSAVAAAPHLGQSVAQPHRAAPTACFLQRRQAPWPAAERSPPQLKSACPPAPLWVALAALVALQRPAVTRWRSASQVAARAVVAARCPCRIARAMQPATTDRRLAPPRPDAARWSYRRSEHWRDWSARRDPAPRASAARSRDWDTARSRPAVAAAAWLFRRPGDRATS